MDYHQHKSLVKALSVSCCFSAIGIWYFKRAYSAWERLGCACGYSWCNIRELRGMRANQNLASIGLKSKEGILKIKRETRYCCRFCLTLVPAEPFYIGVRCGIHWFIHFGAGNRPRTQATKKDRNELVEDGKNISLKEGIKYGLSIYLCIWWRWNTQQLRMTSLKLLNISLGLVENLD